MFKKKLLLFLIFILTIGSVVAYDNIMIDDFGTDCKEYYGSYKYTADYNLSGINSNDLKSVTYFYFDDGDVKNCTKMLYKSDDVCEVSAECYYENKTDVDHVEIVIYDGDDILLNETKNFTMIIDETNNYNTESETESESPSMTYVCSCNSDKFHEPGCTYAKKIRSGNKVTFSSRENAINSGYNPCGVCHT